MKANEKIRCPHCGADSVARLCKTLSGWQVADERLVCAFCSGDLGVPDSETPAAEGNPERLNRLAELLGGADTAQSVSLSDGAECDFCRSCRHFVAHPFRAMCVLSGVDTAPMGSCEHFERKQGDSC